MSSDTVVSISSKATPPPLPEEAQKALRQITEAMTQYCLAAFPLTSMTNEQAIAYLEKRAIDGWLAEAQAVIADPSYTQNTRTLIARIMLTQGKEIQESVKKPVRTLLGLDSPAA